MKKSLLSLLFLITTVLAFGQTRVVTGTVTSDTDNLPIPGASVLVKGAVSGTLTDAKGGFSLSVPTAATTLVIRFVGYTTQEASISGTTILTIKLKEDVTSLSEVIVTGYSTLDRKGYAGAIATVKGDEISKQTFGSFDQALQGAAAGVNVTANGGQPGQQAVVRIRGNGSINGSNVPLYILDGIEITAADFQTLNQSDFESVEILKDAISTGIYGSRGANGVFAITTKKGKAGQIQLNYDMQLGRSEMPEDRLIVMNSSQKIDYELQRGNPYGWTPAKADSLRKVNFNWRDALFQTGKTQQHQISANGGTAATKFYASLAYLDQDGIVQTTGLKRYTVRANVDNQVKNFRFGLGVQGGFSNRNNTSEGNTGLSTPLNAIRWSNPYETAYLPNGEFNVSGGAGTGQLTSGQPNGAMVLFLNRNDEKQIKGIITSYLEYHLPAVKGLYARTNWGGDYTSDEANNFTDPRVSGAAARQGALTRSQVRNFRYTGTTSINYKNVFGKHDVSGGIFTEVVKNDNRSFSFTGYGFTNGFTNEAGLTAGSTANANYIPSTSGSGSQNGLLSYFAMANYGYNGKYFLNLVGRRDGSSRFGANHRWANFGSIGGSWAISDESFMQKVGFINDLRLRASYGTIGSQGTSNYPTALFGRVAYAGTGAWSPASPGNPDLTWETSTVSNIGLDFAGLNNRISGTVEVYSRNTTDQFYNVPVDPSAGGFTSIPSNFGSLKNQGVELTLNGNVLRGSSLKLSIGGNLTYNRNRITDLPQDSVISGVTILAEGRPVNSLYLVPFAGVDPANGNALYRKKDGSITHIFNGADKVILGTSDSPLFASFHTNLSFKGFDASVMVNAFFKRKMYNNDLNNIINPTYFYDNMHISVLNEWKTVGQITDVPKPTATGGINTYQSQTTRFIDDASFWRLRNVVIGYTIPKSALNTVKLRTARIFIQGQNLWTATKFRSFDPEATGTSLTGAQYPPLVQGTLGLTVGF